MDFLCKHTIVIPRLPCLFTIAKTVSSMVVLVNLETPNTIDSFIFGMSAFACKSIAIELVWYSDGWRRTWCPMVHMMRRLQFCSILLCQYTCHEDAYLESFHVIGVFEPAVLEAHHVSNRICKPRSMKSWTLTFSFFNDIITSSKEVFIDQESDITVGISQQRNSSWDTVKWDVIFKQNTSSYILTLQLHTRQK